MEFLLFGALAPVVHDFEYTTSHRDAAFTSGQFGGHEDQTAGRAHDARFRDQNFTDLRGIDELGIELHRGQAGFAGHEPRRHAAAAVRKGHQHAALHHAATVVVLV